MHCLYSNAYRKKINIGVRSLGTKVTAPMILSRVISKVNTSSWLSSLISRKPKSCEIRQTKNWSNRSSKWGGLLNKPQLICKGIFRISVSNCKSQKVYKTGEWFGALNNWVFCFYYIATLGFVSYVSGGNHEEVHLIMWTNQLMSIIYLSVKFHDTGPTGAMQKIDGLIF